MAIRLKSRGQGAIGRLPRFILPAVLGLSGAAAFAQQGVFVGVLNSGVPPSAPSEPSEQSRDEAGQRKPTAPARPMIAGVKLPVAGAKPEDLLDEAAREARDHAFSPPAGTPLAYVNFPNPRTSQHLSNSVVQGAVAGTRLGGGSNSPSPEAVSYDPRDIFDARVVALADPRQP